MGKREASESEMVGLLRRWERSGLSLSRFAEECGVSRKRLYRWRRRTGIGNELVRRGRRPKSLFTEVRPSALRTSGPGSAAPRVPYEVVFADGTRLRISEDFSAQSLQSVVKALRSRC